MKAGDVIELLAPIHCVTGLPGFRLRVATRTKGVVYSAHSRTPGFYYVTFPGQGCNWLLPRCDLHLVSAVDQLGDLAG